MPCARPASTSARFSAWFWARDDARSGNLLASRWQPRWYSMQAQNDHPLPGANSRSKSAHVAGVSSFVAYVIKMVPSLRPSNAALHLRQTERPKGAKSSPGGTACYANSIRDQRDHSVALHEAVRDQKEPVSPAASRMACRSGIVRRRQAELRRSSYHAVARLQSRAKSNTAPGVIWRCAHQATMSSSDRKRSMVDQVKPILRHQSRAGTAKWTIPWASSRPRLVAETTSG